MLAWGSLPTAVDTNTRSPHTIGLDTARPGTAVFHSTFSPVARFHVTGVGRPSPTPDAPGPRNDGQFWPETVTHARTHRAAAAARRMIYLPSTLVHVVASLGKPTDVTFSPSRRNVSVAPGASTTRNVEASRGTKVTRCCPETPP